MDIDLIIAAIKARCASFGQRVSGAAEYKRLSETTNLATPAAYVIPLDDVAEGQQSENSYRQQIKDAIAIVVVLSNTADERGQTPLATVRTLRKELWKALLAWAPDAEHGRISYEGGQLLDLDRAHMYYQFEFSAPTELDESDTYQATANAALPALTAVALKVDEPAGTTEVAATIPLAQ
ncbi:MAG: hypothetical protein M0Q22_15430 [Sulfuritalea sp.]|jgi:hypothetical protein|nr:hypothetical protein [Sulfuritalea sp.]